MEKSGSSSKRQKISNERDLDCTNVARGVWLVKVPKYVSAKWQKAAPLSEAGRLNISKGPDGKNDINFTIAEDLMNDQTSSSDHPSIPNKHKFFISNITHQSLVVFSQGRDNGESSDPNANKLILEGQVVLKAECRPQADDKYMKLKKNSIVKASQPERKLQQLDKLVPTFKPISDHKHNIEFEQKKKAEGKKSRGEKDKVVEILFSAFEKHQYYNIKDLEKITNQPITYLKEILKEYCVYNAKNPHKSMWELKPEFRYYKDQEGKADDE